MKKKILAMVFAATMLLGASMTVSATTPKVTVTSNDATETVSSGEAGSDSVAMVAMVNTASIEVSIEVNGTVVANPYGLTANSLDAGDTLGGAVITFENNSDSPIEVGLKGQIQLPTYADASLAADKKVSIATTESDIKSATTKKVFVKADVVTADSVTSKKVNATGAKYFSITSAGTTKRVAALVYDKSPVELAAKPVLAKADDTDAGYVKKMSVVLSGKTSISPTSPWSADDKFTVVTFYDLKLASTPSVFKTVS